jgi:hypothetical protein
MTGICAFETFEHVSNRRKAAVRDDRPEIKPRQGFQMAKVVAHILRLIAELRPPLVTSTA